MGWQKAFTLSERSKGCHLVTDEVLFHIEAGLRDVQVLICCQLLPQHTSAALTLNENYDRDVRRDMDMALDHIVPERLNWLHTDEGPDDSVSHTKTSLIGPTITIPITNGRLALGTWQGIYLTEFRHAPHSRRVVATIMYAGIFIIFSADRIRYDPHPQVLNAALAGTQDEEECPSVLL
ncbi:hypothetical protein K488DRAFT_40772 [Vararia minispora EC-137]|uniref:Uncharacterized protein n=1 Tax=Vararia minispora EC-137 TaxID=1314806 RepID=A0ACB8QZ17_9AGAM|nr:hypothetical protein K488DRAFT_40772 [Vararia minispora EC-137]